jgi:hypothetical protein
MSHKLDEKPPFNAVGYPVANIKQVAVEAEGFPNPSMVALLGLACLALKWKRGQAK